MASLVIDAIVVCLFLAIVINYTYRGFVASLVGFLSFWIASGVATLFSPQVAEYLQPFVESRLSIENGGDFFSTLLQKMISSGYLSKALAFVLVFIAASIVIKLVEVIVNAMTKLPFINLLNRLFGMAMGVVIGFFWVELIAFAGVSLAEYLNGSLAIFPEGTFQNTVVVKWLYEHNIFRWIVERFLTAFGK